MPNQTDGPRLLVFAPCERVIVGAEGDGSASLISILQGFKVSGGELSTTEELPDNSYPAFPAPWYFFSLWENDFKNNTYEQKFELRSAKGKVLISITSQQWSFQDNKRFHRVVTRVNAFPLAGAGDYKAVVLIKRVGAADFTEVATFPIPVNEVAE